MSSSRLTLYIWPHRWSLPSFDPDCLSCVFYLQLNFAGKYDLVECTDPDVSPSGSLPFLIHEEKQVATSRSVLSYLSKLKGGENGLRGNGTNEERLVKAQRTAWSAYVDSHLRDLVVRDIIPASLIIASNLTTVCRTTFYMPTQQTTGQEYTPL